MTTGCWQNWASRRPPTVRMLCLDAPAPAEMTKAPAPTPQTETPVLQLKIMLNGSKPPIWRRVLVPAGMPLPQLHTVIQALFGWLDYHLHEFRTGGFRGPAYAPLTGEDDFLR